MSIVPAGQGVAYVIASVPKWLIAVLATISLPFFLWTMKEWSQAPWMEGPALISLLPLILGVMALIMVPALWMAAWMDHKEAKVRKPEPCTTMDGERDE